MRRCLMVLAAVMVVAGCSDPKAANESNFKAAIQQHLDTVYPRCYVIADFPYSTKGGFFNRSKEMGALAAVGVVSVKEIDSKEKSYELTELGKTSYKENAGTGFSGQKLSGLCFGKASVTAVTQFSEPAEILGHKVSQVNYEYTVSDLPDWAQTAQVQGAFAELKKDVQSKDKPRKALDTVLLTNKGWVHERQFRK